MSMIRILPLLVVGALSVSGQAFAQTQGPSTSPSTPAAQPSKAAHAKPAFGSPDEVICKHQDIPGSRLGGARVCHTRQEWDEISRIAHDELDRSEQTVRGPS
jgi:hypothetical protein